MDHRFKDAADSAFLHNNVANGTVRQVAKRKVELGDVCCCRKSASKSCGEWGLSVEERDGQARLMPLGLYVVSRIDSELSQLRLKLGIFENEEREKDRPRLACQDEKFRAVTVKQEFGAALFECFLVIQLILALV